MIDRLRVALLGCVVCVGCGSDSPLGPSQTDGQHSGPAAAGAPEKPAKERGDAAAGPAAPVLYDARDRTKAPPGVEREPKVAPEVEQLVLDVVSQTHKAKREDCQGAAEMTLRVRASATGSFTAPATRQVAYVLASAACGAPDAIETAHLVVVEGDKLVMHASGARNAAPDASPSFFGTDVRAVVDLDQDGVSELLVTSSDASEKGVEESARLYSVAGGQLKALGQFPGVYVDGCAAGPQGQAQAQVIHYRAGPKDGASRFSTEAYQAPCPASGPPAPSDFQPVKPAAPASSPTASPPSASAEPSPKPS